MMTELKFKNILFATDFLQSSRLALDYAVALAHHFKSKIKMLHVVELSDAGLEAELTALRPCMTRLEAENRLDALASGVRRTGLDVETRLADGVPHEVIMARLPLMNRTCWCLGPRGVHMGLWLILLLDPNAEKILLSVPCPTLTVGGHALGGIDLLMNPKEILYFSDFTPEATAAAPYAILLGKEFHVPVDVCQLVPVIAEGKPWLREKLAHEYCEVMREVISATDAEWCEPAFHQDHGMEIDEIIQRAQTRLAALIVLGVRRQSQLKRRFHTSFAYQLLAKASCPVLTIPDLSSAGESGRPS